MEDHEILDGSLFNQLGGRSVLEKVHKIFYDKIYAHPWIGQYFAGIDQGVIEIQQTEFMMGAMGGEKIYCGKMPVPAHKHMMISDELFELRHFILKESLDEAGVDSYLRDRWLKIDKAFRSALVKKSLDDCQKRFATDEILDYKDISNFKKVA